MLIRSRSPDVAKKDSLIIKCKLLLLSSTNCYFRCSKFSFSLSFFSFIVEVDDDDDDDVVVIIADGIALVKHMHLKFIHFRHARKKDDLFLFVFSFE